FCGEGCYRRPFRWWHPSDWFLHRSPYCTPCCAPCPHPCPVQHVGVCGPHASACCTRSCNPCSSCFRQRFWDWLTYQPHRCQGCCRWSTAPCCNPPLYAYFLCCDCKVHYTPCPTCPPPTAGILWDPPTSTNDAAHSH